MSVISSAIVWDHRARTKKGCEGPLEYRITIDRKSWYINMGVKVARNEWKFGAVINRPDADVLNERLRILSEKIMREINRCIDEGMPVDVADIRERVWSPVNDNQRNDMVLWMRAKLEKLQIAKDTNGHYRVMIESLERSGLTSWKDVTVENLKKWSEDLRMKKSKRFRQTDSNDMEQVKDSTLGDYHSKFKAMLRRAMAEGLINYNPYDFWRPEIKPTRYDMIDYLSEDEIEKLRNYTPRTKAQCRAKDVFLFQCFTGLAYVDAMRFDKDNYKLVNGHWVTTVRRVKTGVPFVNVLLPPVVEILERYNWKLPEFCLAWYNVMLADIGRQLGLDIRLRSHVARHTFATMMLRNGVKIENLARMLGHTNITQTQRYAKVLAVSVQEEFEMIEKKMFN